MRAARQAAVSALAAAWLVCAPAQGAETLDSFSSRQADFALVQIAEGLDHPWSLAFLPDGDMLVTERGGRLWRVGFDGAKTEVSGLPPLAVRGQGGLLDVVLHPDFDATGWVYFTHAAAGDGGVGTAVTRARLAGERLVDVEQLFRMARLSGGGRHFGSRLVFLEDGTFVFSIGDRGHDVRAQDLMDHAGSLIRLNADGSVPADNPFVGRDDALPEIYSYGHRNPQGMTVDPDTGRIWEIEHGAQGGDEVNTPRPGLNYGWPVISYGEHYGGGQIGVGTEAPGMEQPVYYWDPSIAPSGADFYDGEAFANWRGDLFVGALKFRLLVRLEVENGEVIEEERLIEDEIGRIRYVETGPDGFVYLLTDESDGGVYRLEPR